MSTWRLAWLVSQHKSWYFWAGSVAFLGFFALPAATGYILGQAFGALELGETARIYRLAALLLVIEALRMGFLHVGAVWFSQSWEFMRGLLRGNMLAAQLSSGGPGAGRPVASAGEAITRFRDDTEDVAWFVDAWLDVAGGVVFTVLALGVLATVDLRATAVMLLPMAVVGIVTTVLGRRLRAVHRADRQATTQVTGLLGDVLAAVVTIKVNRAEGAALARLGEVMDRRRSTAVRSRVFNHALHSVSQSTADIGLGLVVLVAVGSLQRGSFGVGEIALFVGYGGWLGFLPRMIGLLLARSQQASVAFHEMGNLVAGGDPGNTVAYRHLPFEQRNPDRPDPVGPARVPLARLEVDGLCARHPGGAGIVDVSFSLDRGAFTVVTGPVGSGKTTLLRALLGLGGDLTTTGAVRWNGRPVDDRAAFFVPPQAAYVAQVPQLVSDSLADNVLLGSPDRAALDRSLGMAAVAGDVARMASGAATTIGPRGLRLSGGQRQRVATARALVHRPELLVLDDLSSALDVETELRLWRNLAAAGTTILAVSHRLAAIERADQVLRLEGGRLAVV
jgi:ATP-binding cassette subfamily B protein